MKQALAWSKAVNKTIEEIVRGVPPFPYVRECLEKLTAAADMIVVSATPSEALKREWEEHDLAKYVARSAARRSAARKNRSPTPSKYPAGPHADDRRRPRRLQGGRGQRRLVLSDQSRRTKTPVGGGSTTRASTASSTGTFAGEYQEQLLDEFDAILPEQPPWKA